MSVDATRKATFAQKRGMSVAAYNIIEGTEKEEIDLSVTESYKIGTLPENALIANAYVYVKTASDAATSAVATLGTTDGGTQIMSAIDLTSTGLQGTFTGESDTGSGVEVWFGATITGASTNVGEYVVVIEYVEYRLKTGYYTAFEL